MRRARRHRDNEDRRSRYSVRRNAIEFSGIEWTRAATKHRISWARSGNVVEQAGSHWEEDAPALHPQADVRLWFFGDDADGVPLEVACIACEDGCLVAIHAMPIRSHYREYYEEARRWQGKSDTP